MGSDKVIRGEVVWLSSIYTKNLARSGGELKKV